MGGSARRSKAGYCIPVEHGCSETSRRSSACASATRSRPGTFWETSEIYRAQRSFSFCRSGWKKDRSRQVNMPWRRRLVQASAPKFRWIVLLHTAVLLGAALEVVLLRRPFVLWLAVPMFAVFLAANVVRWWVIPSLGEHWKVQVVDSTRLGVVTSGPFRYVRHPNYAAVFAEMLALPLIHTACITAAAG